MHTNKKLKVYGRVRANPNTSVKDDATLLSTDDATMWHIAKVYDLYDNEGVANAERLVLCWNYHDELVGACEELVGFIRKKHNNIVDMINDGLDVCKKAEEILAKVRPETDDNDVRS